MATNDFHILRGRAELEQAVPLRPIETEDELDRAIAMIDTLCDRNELSDGEKDYMLALSDLIEKYEDVHYPMPCDDPKD
jgi:HTH-type transcriptional regulator/antitoxin HigA